MSILFASDANRFLQKLAYVVCNLYKFVQHNVDPTVRPVLWVYLGYVVYNHIKLYISGTTYGTNTHRYIN